MQQPKTAQMLDLAKWHWNAKQYAQAEELCRKILAIDARHVKAMQMLAELAMRGMRPEAALPLLARAAALEPGEPDVQLALGNAQFGLGQVEAAIESYRRVIVLSPNSLPAHNNLSLVLKKAGRMAESIEVLKKLIALRPDYPEAYAVLANAMSAEGRARESLEFYRRSLELGPTVAATHVNYGAALCKCGEPAAGAAAIDRGIELGLHSADAYNHRGVAMKAAGKLRDAVTAYRQAIRLRPDFSEAWTNLGVALRTAGFLDQAMEAYRQAIEHSPRNAEAHNVMGNALWDMGRRREAEEEYRKALALRPDYLDANDNLVYTLYFSPEWMGEQILDEHRKWNQRHAAALLEPGRGHGNERWPEKKLRIGYVSGDFRNHVVGFNLLPMFMNHDRERHHITCYSNARAADQITERFKNQADVWREIAGVPDAEAAEQVRADGIDILVDLSLHMQGSRLLIFARKPAPVQVTFAGYPGTTGVEAIDYRLTDPYLDPPGEMDGHYSERSVRLADSFWIYCPMDDLPAVNELPAEAAGHVTLGCLSNFSKVNEVALGWWGRVMRAVENSRLVLLAGRGRHRREVAEALGVDVRRVRFVEMQPRGKYLAEYHRIDLGLDTFPYNGHTTSLDAAWMGVPVVSVCGKTVVSRAGWSQANNLGLTELVAQSPEAAAEIAIRLAGDLPRLAEIRRTLRGRLKSGPLGDAVKFTRSIEGAYRQMWREWCEKGTG